MQAGRWRPLRLAGSNRPSTRTLARTALTGALMLLPGGLVVYLGFHAGGFFARQHDVVAAFLALVIAATIALDAASTSRPNRPLQVCALCYAAYAAWALVSLTWSHAPLRATREFSVTLLYLLAFVLYGWSTSSARRLRWLVRGLALGCFAVCLAALISRTLPAVWPIASSFDTPRLSYPVTYWNALGLLAAIGAILCLCLSSDEAEPTTVKAAGALAVPVFAATLLLTFSRGAIGAGLVGALAYIALARSRSLVGALISIVPAATVALAAAYAADALAKPVEGNLAAVAQGHHLAAVVALCSIAAAGLRVVLAVILDRRLAGLSWRAPGSRRSRRTAAGIAIALAVVIALAAGAPHAVRRQYHAFVRGNTLPRYAQPRDRLTAAGADGRIDLWRVSIAQFDSAPLRGTGAGTFELAWRARRPGYVQVVNAHSLYAENLGNLGIVGLALLAVVLLGSLAALALRLRGPTRAVWAGALAAALAWAVHAGVDWDWQMPVVTLPIFALAGAGFARARSATSAPLRRLLTPARGALCTGALALAALLGIAARSESRISTSLAAFEHNDCAAATSAARASLSPLSFRPDAHEVLGYCEAAAGQSAAAVGDMRRAVAEDPGNWETHYGLSIVLAAAGRDPRAEMARARALDPKNAVPLVAATFFRYALRSYWPQESAVDLIQIDRQGDRNLDDLRPRPATARR